MGESQRMSNLALQRYGFLTGRTRAAMVLKTSTRHMMCTPGRPHPGPSHECLRRRRQRSGMPISQRSNSRPSLSFTTVETGAEISR